MILEKIQNSDQPLCAQQIYEEMKEALDLATVYRGLKYLEENSEISSFLLDCSERGVERYYSSFFAHHKHYMHCMACHRFTPIDTCPLGGFESLEKKTGFRIDEHFLTLKGLCKKCQNK